jgi:hypothetical protein
VTEAERDEGRRKEIRRMQKRFEESLEKSGATAACPAGLFNYDPEKWEGYCEGAAAAAARVREESVADEYDLELLASVKEKPSSIAGSDAEDEAAMREWDQKEDERKFVEDTYPNK